MILTCNSTEFKNATQATIFAVMESDGDEYILEGVSIRCIKGEKVITFIGCDGYRLSTYSVLIEGEIDKDTQITLPVTWLGEVADSLKLDEVTLDIKLSGITIKTKEGVMSSLDKFYKDEYFSIARVKSEPRKFVWQAVLLTEVKINIIKELIKVDLQKDLSLDSYNIWLVLSPLGLNVIAKCDEDHLSEGIHIGRIPLQDIALNSKVYSKYSVVIDARYFFDSIFNSPDTIVIIRGFSSFPDLESIKIFPNAEVDSEPLEIISYSQKHYQCITGVTISNKLKYPELFMDEIE